MRRELAWIGWSAGLTSMLVVAAYGCGQTSSGSCTDNGTCAVVMEAGGDQTAPSPGSGAEASVDAGADADAGDGFDGYVCDPTKTPAQDPCVISDGDGFFVSPKGRSGAAGTMADPFLLVGDAIAAATGHSDRVLVCAGSYDEALTLGSTPGQDAGSAGVQDAESEAAQEEASFTGGVTVFGGLDCANGWKYTGAKAVLAPSTRGTALTVKGLMVGLTFVDFGFHSIAATQSGESSIAVFASDTPAPGLVLIRCDIQAGAGQPGMDQVGVMGFDAGAPPGQAGTATGGGATTPNACGGVATASVGGAGGQPAAMGTDGTDGTPGPSNKGTAAGCAMGTGTGNVGGPGVSGAAGASGPGAVSWATFDQNGWVTVGGMSGGPGAVGQGGGGGGSVAGGGGSGGGAGGCGGVGGAPGTGGGSSIAVLVYQSSLDLEQCSITTDSAGRGGNGAAGQIGESPGGKGLLLGGTGCPGGNGGAGGTGGGGGGGAGGLAVGVLWSGTAPTIDQSPIGQAAVADAGGDAGTLAQTVVGSAGVGGIGGGSGMDAGSNAGTNGKAGTSAAVMQLQ